MHRRVNRRDKRCAHVRLSQKERRSGIQCTLFVAKARGEHDDGNFLRRGVFLKLFHHLKSILFRHAHVKDDGVRTIPPNGGHGLLPVQYLFGQIAGGVQPQAFRPQHVQ